MSFVLLGILNSQAAAPVPSVFPLPGVTPDLWLDAADASTITASGGSVSQWDNKGSKSNFVQATSADQPTTGATTQNGLNVIDFSDDFVRADGPFSDYNFLHDGTVYFMAMVVSYTSSGSINRILDTQSGGSNNVGFSYGYDDRSGNNGILIIVGNGSNRAALISDTSGIVDTNFNVASAFLDPTASPVSDRVDYYIDNTQGSSTNTESGGVSASDSTVKFAIGDDGGTPLIGSIGEIIIVSGADATEANRQTVVDYLNDKWSVFV